MASAHVAAQGDEPGAGVGHHPGNVGDDLGRGPAAEPRLCLAEGLEITSAPSMIPYDLFVKPNSPLDDAEVRMAVLTAINPALSLAPGTAIASLVLGFYLMGNSGK